MSWFGHDHWKICGLVYLEPLSQRVRYLPQVKVEAHATIISSVSRTTLKQTFVNPNTKSPLDEVRYQFPLFDGVSVVGFTCTIGDRIIKGVVKEKQKAREVYNEAIARGETAGLLEQLPAASDVFTTSLGNIPAGAEIQVDITYLGELKHDAQVDGIRLTIPTCIAPRYGDYPEDLVGVLPISSSSGIKITVDAQVPNGCHITSIQSPSHPITVALGRTSIAPQAEPSFQRASASLALGTAELDTDFILQVVATNTGNPLAVLEQHPTIPHQRALMATLVPKFSLPPEKPEIVFVCDRSGSMDGKIANLQAALRLFVKSLNVGIKFNICSFGSSHTFLWDRSRTYDQSSVTKAMAHIETFSANYGGTEMYNPLEETFKRRYKDMNLEVFMLTDGEVWDQERLMKMIGDNVTASNGGIRLFTLGIGTGVSHALIEGVARAGNGFSQAIADNEDMSGKVVRMLKGALFPHIKDYSLEVKYAKESAAASDEDDDFEVVERVLDGLVIRPRDDETVSSQSTTKEETPKPTISLFDATLDPDVGMKDGGNAGADDRYSHLPSLDPPKIFQTPFNIPPLFPFNRTTVYLLMSPETDKRTPKSVVLRGTSSHGPVELEIPVSVLEAKGETIHQLAAKKATVELEEGRGWIYHAKDPNGQLLKSKYDGRFQDMVEREAVRLGVQYQVGGKWCSFVAVEENQERVQNPIIATPQRRVPMASVASSQPKKKSSRPFSARGQLPTGALTYNSLQERKSDSVQKPVLQSLACDDEELECELEAMQEACLQLQPTGFVQPSLMQSLASGRRAPRMRMSPSAPSPNTASYGAAPAPKSSLGDVAEKRRSSGRGGGGGAVGAIRSFFKSAASQSPPALVPRSAKASESGIGPGGPPSGGSAVREGAAVSPAERLRALIVLHSFEGYWDWDPLLPLMGWDAKAILSAWGTDAPSENVVATALVVAWLNREMADQKDTWELLVDKAIAWMDSQLGDAHAGGSSGAVKKAGEVLKTL